MGFVHDLTPFVLTFVVLDVLATLALVGGLASVAVPFFSHHRTIRVSRHESFVPYYRHVALHH